MALSQYVAINFLTKFDKKGLERATKELKGFDKVVATGSFRLRAFAKAGGVAAAAGLAIFTKNSIQAALAQERLDKQLQLTLKSIGQEFALPDVKNFVADLQQATNVTEDQLVPALQKLIAQTGDLQSSQYLLSKALDISAGTGADLDSVLNAINKAAIGQYTAIGKLGVGFTAAEAKAMGFVELMQNLDKYGGSAEAQTKTLAGQLASFRISAGEATETLGQGLLTSVSLLATGSDQLDVFGFKLQKVATQFADIMVGTAGTFEKKGLGAYLDFVKVGIEGITGEATYAGNTLQKIELEGIKLREKRILQERGYIGLSQITIDNLERQRLYGKKELSTEQILAKIQKDILAREKALTKEKSAQAALEKKKAELAAMFDIERINLQAALSRKLSAEDELRVKILQKLADGTAKAIDEAQRYADVLKIIEDGQITTAEIEMLATKWGVTTTEVLLYLEVLFKANEELRKMLALLDLVATKQKAIASLSAGQQVMLNFGIDPSQIGAGGTFTGGSNFAASPIMPRSNPNFASSAAGRALGLALGFTAMAEGGIVNSPTLAMIGEAGAEAVIPLDKMGSMGTTINVNVAGSVISEGQLQSVIQDALYNLNRSGAVTQLTNLGR
jgi:hypothetical protein